MFMLDSDLIRLNVFGNNIVVVNSLEAATDLFEKRSSQYSDRCVRDFRLNLYDSDERT